MLRPQCLAMLLNPRRPRLPPSSNASGDSLDAICSVPDLLLRHGPSRCNLRPTSVDSAGVERSRTCSAPLPYRELGEREVAACANLRLRLTKVRGSLSALAA